MTFSEEFKAYQREAALIAEQMALAATIVSKTNYARHGRYIQLFFTLSIAIERACKLILIVDSKLNNKDPKLLNLQEIRHDLIKLCEKVDQISDTMKEDEIAKKPQTEIHKSILEIISLFARNITRYYNIDLLLKNNSQNSTEPISQWYKDVIIPVFEHHVSKRKKRVIEKNANSIGMLADDLCFVRFTREDGKEINNITEGSYQAGLIEATSPYVRMYILQIVRYLSYILSEQGGIAMKKSVDIPYFSAFFRIFYNQDNLFKKKKMWKII